MRKGKTFALIIDEAHSSQGGKTSAAMSAALADPEDTVNDALEKRMQARKMLTNASYFAFTATPKNKTLEMFGQPLPPDAEGKVKHRPFHSYTMKQAIQEGFILDVLKSYTPVDSYYKLVKKIEDDPEFDTKRAQKKLRRYVEEPRPRHPPQGRNHGGPFPRAGAGAQQDRRQGAGDGGLQRHRAGHPVFPRLPGLSRRAQESLSGHRRLLRRARIRRGEGQRVLAQRLPQRRHRRENSGRPLSLPHLRRQVPDRLRRAVAAHHVCGQAARRHQSRADALPPEPRPPGETRRLRARFPEQQRDDHTGVCRLLPHHSFERGNRPGQVARPQGRAGQRPGLFTRASADAGGFVSCPARPATSSTPSSTPASPSTMAARRGRPGGLQGQGQDLCPHLRLSCRGAALHQSAAGSGFPSC